MLVVWAAADMIIALLVRSKTVMQIAKNLHQFHQEQEEEIDVQSGRRNKERHDIYKSRY